MNRKEAIPLSLLGLMIDIPSCGFTIAERDRFIEITMRLIDYYIPIVPADTPAPITVRTTMTYPPDTERGLT